MLDLLFSTSIGLVCLFLLTVSPSCSKEDFQPNSLTSIEFAGRHLRQLPIYRVKVPKTWQCRLPSPDESIADTTKPLCEFFIREGEQQEIRITIHQFPTEKIDDRTPPQAQISRWKQQFDQLDQNALFIIPQSFSGFVGLLFEASGIMKGKETTVMGWSMQIAGEHYHRMSDHVLKEMRADVTIKVVGPKTLVSKYRPQLVAFGRSFELIQEIPKTP